MISVGNICCNVVVFIYFVSLLLPTTSKFSSFSNFSNNINNMSQGKLGIVDPSSYSNYDEVVVTDILLSLDVNFNESILSGFAKVTCLRKIENPKYLVLDSNDLNIKKTQLENGEGLPFTLSKPFKTFGSALSIQLPNGPEQSKFSVIIEYHTSPNASGFQWLTPEQTAGKKEPYLFSQFQAIHARSAYPCQDAPGVKFRYSAEISAPEQLTVLMSALHVGEPEKISNNRHLFKFNQPVPIPSYLIAFAIGRISFRRLGPRSRVWAEPETLDAAAYEFAETEKILDAAISLCGDYEWSVYDLLVMPPSFPFGGMENPCLTFVTPTVLAGDRSLVDVVAHEIAHSWSGNLVTTATFEHFWLNEGWTMFIERKIHEILHGPANRHFHAVQGLESLKETVEKTLGVNSEFTKLVPNLKNTDPDDAFSVVPYEKGHTFLFYLEQLMGGADAFNPFIKAYFANFKNTSITTDDFKKFFTDFFKNKEQLKKIDWESWLYKPGMPIIIPEYDMTLVDACVQLAKECRSNVSFRSSPDDQPPLSSVQKSLFIQKLLEGEPLPADSVKELAERFEFNEARNSEIRFRWLRLGLRAHELDFVPKALEFINEQGRMKFVRPIYRDLYEWKEVRKQAVENYRENKNAMMFVLANQLLKDLHITE